MVHSPNDMQYAKVSSTFSNMNSVKSNYKAYGFNFVTVNIDFVYSVVTFNLYNMDII